ncbi:MAG TPA: hypothetical protein VN911_11740 [Candidatus Acidoferrum sp.]|nr:hypothetical protein [Candidatus Acidoferrum sp.]
MDKVSSSDCIGVAGIVLAILLVVLDKAGKLKGGWLYGLLFVAGLMTLFIAVGNDWVMDAPTKWKVWRGLLMFCVVGLTYSGIAIWITPSEEKKTEQHTESEARPGVGASPTTSQTVTSRPQSGLASKEESVRTPTVPPVVHLMFKDAALLTPERKKRITNDINGVARYLRSFGPLGLPIPDDLPPIGVDTKNSKGEGWSFNSQGDNKYYYNQFTLQQGALDKQTKITEAFLSFVVGRFTYEPPPPMPPNLEQMTPQQFLESGHTPAAMDRSYRWMTSVVIVQYLNHSYWNRPLAENEKPVCPDRGNGMSYYFWQMRERFGKDFADKLAVLTLRASVDKPYTGAHADAVHPYRYYLYERLTLADSVIDNENSRMPEIDSILKECSWLPLT